MFGRNRPNPPIDSQCSVPGALNSTYGGAIAPCGDLNRLFPAGGVARSRFPALGVSFGALQGTEPQSRDSQSSGALVQALPCPGNWNSAPSVLRLSHRQRCSAGFPTGRTGKGCLVVGPKGIVRIIHRQAEQPLALAVNEESKVPVRE